MDYKAATKQLKRVGTAHAQGDALRAMYAGLVALQHGGAADKYYAYFQEYSEGEHESEIRRLALPLMQDRARTWDVLMGITPCKECKAVSEIHLPNCSVALQASA